MGANTVRIKFCLGYNFTPKRAQIRNKFIPHKIWKFCVWTAWNYWSGLTIWSSSKNLVYLTLAIKNPREIKSFYNISFAPLAACEQALTQLGAREMGTNPQHSIPQEEVKLHVHKTSLNTDHDWDTTTSPSVKFQNIIVWLISYIESEVTIFKTFLLFFNLNLNAIYIANLQKFLKTCYSSNWKFCIECSIHGCYYYYVK